MPRAKRADCCPFPRKSSRSRRMSTVAAMASSSLNPNAPLFIPAAYRQVEDFSPEWWELVNTTAWFRDHWFRQHQLHEAAYDAAFSATDADDFDVAALLPDDSVDLLDTDDLFYAPDIHQHQAAKPTPAPALLPGYDLDVLRALSLSSPRAAVATAPSPRAQQQQQRHADKPAAYHAGARGAARHAIHQPR